jgi:hypothetical protein
MRRIAVIPLVLLLGLSASRVQGGTVTGVPAVQTAGGPSFTWRLTIGADQSATMGWSFTVGAANLEVTALGFYDDGMNGNQDAHPVGIWTAGGTLLAQVTVPAGTAGTLVGSYRYAAISPLTLTAGQTYVVGTYFGPVVDVCGSACGDVLLILGTQTYDSRLTYQQARQTLAMVGPGSLAFPGINNIGAVEGFFGPNLLLTAVPTAPILSLGVPSLGFGNVIVGQPSAPQSVTVTNSGTAALSLGSLATSGAQAADFALGNDTCSGQSVAPSGNCTFEVTFTPTATLSRVAQVNIPSNASSSPDALPLSGTGVQAQIAVAPDPLGFGSVNVGQPSAAQTVTVTNSGTAALSLGALATSGAQAADFALGNDTCSGQSVVPSGNCTFDVTFTPTAAGSRLAQVNIPSNAPSSPDVLAVSGTGLQPQVAVAPDPLGFGNVIVGGTDTQSVTVTNAGDGVLSVSAVTAPTAPFAPTGGSCGVAPFTVAAGGSCTLAYAFSPGATGLATQLITVSSDAPAGSDDQFTLQGTGVQPAASLDLTSLSFGPLAPGDAASDTVTVTNNGDGDLVISGLTDPGPPFSITGGSCTALPATVPPGASCTLVIQFAPATSAGLFNASFAIQSNAPSSPDSIDLSGIVGVVAVPTLDRWGLALLALLLGWCGWRFRRRIS